MASTRRMEKLRVFVGSSMEARPVVERIVTELGTATFSIIPWYHDKFAAGSRYFLDLLLDAPDEQEFDFAVFVLRTDDLTKSRGKVYYTPRDNVLFELGIFMSGLGKDRKGRHRTFLLAPKPWKTRLKILSDFQGYTPHYYEPPSPARTKDGRLANLAKVLKPVLREIKKQMQASGPRDSQRLEQVAWVSPLLTEYFKTPAKQRLVKNLALDLGATWNIYQALLEQPDIRQITIQTLMMDGRAPEVIAASGKYKQASPTAKRALESERMLIGFCKTHARDLAKRGILFECRAYPRVPFVHGFLLRRHKLLLTTLLLENGKMKGTPNPYWELDYPKTASTSKNRTARHSFDAYESWFDQQWTTARPVWPAAKRKS